MRVNNLYLKNIASLKGTHHLNFEELYSHSNLLAITGETGAGKSTILSAISMSLYGQSHKKNYNQTDIVTTGEIEGEIKIDFSINGLNYISSWACRVRKKNGELLKLAKPKRNLFQVNSKDNSEKEIMTPIEEIIGLSFEQFIKTIILNQGQFSRFLLSTFTERKKILETLLTNHNLAHLSVTNKRNLSKVEHELQIILSKIEGLKSQQSLDKKELTHNLELNKIEEKKLKQEKDQLKIIIKANDEVLKTIKLYQESVYKKINSDNELSTITKEINILNQELIVNKKKLDDQIIQNSKELPKLREFERIEQELKNLEKQKTIQSDSHKKLSDQLNAKAKNIELQSKKISDLDKNSHQTKEKIQHTYKDAISIKDLDLLIVQIEQSSRESETIQIHYKNAQSELQTLNKQVAKLVAQEIKLSEQLPQKSILEQVKTLERELTKLKEENQSTAFKLKEIDKLESQKKVQMHKANEANAQVLKMEKEKVILLKEKALLSDALQGQKLKIQIRDMKQQSVNKKLCLVCGNSDLSHIHIDGQDIKISGYEADLEINSQRLKEIDLELGLKHHQADSINKELELIDKDLKKKETLTQSYQESKILIETQSIELDSLNTKKVLRVHLAAEKDKVQKALKELNDQKEKLNKKANEYSESIKKLDKIITEKTSSLSLYVNNLKPDQIIAQILTLKEDLILLKEILQIQKDRDYTKNFLNEQKKEVKELEKSKKEIELNLEELNISLNSYRAKVPEEFKNINLVTLIKELDDKQIHLQKEHDKKSLLYNQQKIEFAQKQSRNKMLTEQIQAYDNQFILLKNSFKEFKDSYGFIKKVAQIKELKSVSLDLFVETQSFLQQQLNELNSKLEVCLQEISKATLLLKQLKETEDLIKESKTEIDLLSERKVTLEKLASIVGKDEFRNYVLSLVEKNLILATNHQLNQLCQGRYSLEQKVNTSTASTDYYVIDKLNFRLDRKISTLSGGETFMVSLAMALALSELTRGTNTIESFFIDEGFGTLDSESIEEVLEMLNSIKTQGKSITLISHIKEITNRVPINIKINKANSGHSTIQIEAN